MQKFSKIFIRVMVGVAIIVGLFALFATPKEKEASVPLPMPIQATQKAATVSIIIDTGDVMQKFPEVPFREGMTVLTALQALAATSDIQLSTKDFGGELGVFIESINGVGLGDKTKWWQFFVNNEYSTVGASAYVLRAGDEVVFEFLAEQPKTTEVYEE